MCTREAGKRRVMLLWEEKMECACTPTGNQWSNSNIFVMNATVGVAVLPAANKAGFGQHDTKLSVPLLTTLQARSPQQVRHLTGAKTVDSESKWQTDHTLHQQQSQTTERQSSAPTPSVSLWCHHPAFRSSPHLNSPLTLYRSCSSLPTQAQHTTEGGQGAHSRRKVLYNNNVQMFMNVQTLRDPWGNVLLIAQDQCLLFLLCLKSSIRHTHWMGD